MFMDAREATSQLEGGRRKRTERVVQDSGREYWRDLEWLYLSFKMDYLPWNLECVLVTARIGRDASRVLQITG